VVKRLRILDESSVNLALTRRYGWAAQSERCYGEVPKNGGKNISVVTTLTLAGIDLETTIWLEGSLNRDTFETYMLDILGPHLEEGEIIILDNLSSHLSPKVEQELAKKGCKLLFLPAYSPDLSPIELAFAKVKAFLRAVGARTKEALEKALEEALALITPQDAAAFFKHCGYNLLAL
jgi:transposase